jgi:hypothetical protein
MWLKNYIIQFLVIFAKPPMAQIDQLSGQLSSETLHSAVMDCRLRR